MITGTSASPVVAVDAEVALDAERAGAKSDATPHARSAARGVTRGGASARIARTTRVMVTEPDAADAPATCARDTPPRLRVKCTRESRSS